MDSVSKMGTKKKLEKILGFGQLPMNKFIRGSNDMKQRLEQILRFAGDVYVERIKRVKRVNKALKEIIDMLYPRVIRARVLYEVKRNDVVMLLACGHILNVMFGEPSECSICQQVYILYDFVLSLHKALSPRADTRIALRHLRNKLKEYGYE